VVKQLEDYLSTRFNNAQIQGNLTGRVMVDYVWTEQIGRTHAYSVGLALLSVFLVCWLVFRSFSKSLIALIPVILSVLSVYGTMWVFDIDLGMGTAMFAAIAIGLGVDFSVHCLHRLEHELAAQQNPEQALNKLFSGTGRALMINFLVIASGFGVLIFSSVPPLQTFGLLVAVGVSVAFITSVTVIPVIMTALKARQSERSNSFKLNPSQ
jgi:predicted RND superfamily exporter protein